MKKVLIVVTLWSLTESVFGQHQHHGESPKPAEHSSKTDSTKAVDHSMHQMNMEKSGTMSNENGMMRDMAMLNYGFTMDTTMGMTHSLSRHLSMNRNGSGTSWHPDNTPMYAYMATPSGSKWSYMLHYAVYLRYTSQNINNSDKRGHAQQFGAPNWVMGMAQRNVGRKGLLQVRAMLSLDPLTVGLGGYPLLFQTGESYKGQPLIDKQHPHDLFSELSVSYSHAFTKDIDVYGYVGYPGEPALGPPAFMHRISSFGMPSAPLSHHWQDASHIVFGVATAGFRYKWAKLEASSFTGREPDEFRYGFDKPRFDSYSYRLSVNPSPSFAIQFSQGFLKSPEDLHPGEDVVRTTASILHSKGLGLDRYVTSALVWGHNSLSGVGSNSFLAESNLQLGKQAFYGRFENVTKSLEELGITLSGESHHQNYSILSLTLGTNYRIVQTHNTDLALGVQLTAGTTGQFLQAYYGKTPLSGEIYLRLSPSLMTMRTMKHSHHAH